VHQTDVQVVAEDVQRLLRMAIVDWYSWLALQAARKDDWRGVPAWCKRMPSQLDLPWAIHELPKHVGNVPMIRVLGDVVERANMSCQSVEGVPSMEKLNERLQGLLGVLND